MTTVWRTGSVGGEKLLDAVRGAGLSRWPGCLELSYVEQLKALNFFQSMEGF